MVKRSECLYDGEIIGIESIYTVIDGKQINIPDKVESLREKGRNGLLTCPCGCGMKLTLVAGDRNLKQQHFREQNGESYSECTLKREGMDSVDSKIVLKCWLDDKLKSEVLTRVRLNKFEHIDNNFEISHYVHDFRFGVNYTYNRTNLSDEKMPCLNDVFSKRDRRILYITDISNMDNNTQYPEFMMKIQNLQRYCLFLKIEERDYLKAELQSVFYYKDIKGLYHPALIRKTLLRNCSISENRELLMDGEDVNLLLLARKNEIEKKLEQDRIEEKRLAKEREEKQKEEERIREQERKRRAEEAERQKKLMKEQYLAALAMMQKEAEMLAKAEEEKKKKGAAEALAIKSDVEERIDSCINEPCVDALGNYWYKCNYCGLVAKADKFCSYGGENQNARGTCHNCSGKRLSNIVFAPKPVKKTAEDSKCPECGGQLVRRKGAYGYFFGCSNYPKCRYTR